MKNLFKNGSFYLRNWLIFCVITGFLFSPVNDPANFSYEKAIGLIDSVIIALLCFIIFTPLQNKFNKKRTNFKLVCFFIITSFLSKFIYNFLLLI